MHLVLSTIIISLLSIQQKNAWDYWKWRKRLGPGLKDMIESLKHVGNKQLLEQLLTQLPNPNGTHMDIDGHDITISLPSNHSYCKFGIRKEKDHTGFRIGQSRARKGPGGTNLCNVLKY